MLKAEELLVRIIEEHFGDASSVVAGVLISRPRLSLEDITRYADLPFNVVREVLLTLIAHGMVIHIQNEYVLVADNIFFKLFIPRVSALAIQTIDSISSDEIRPLVDPEGEMPAIGEREDSHQRSARLSREAVVRAHLRRLINSMYSLVHDSGRVDVNTAMQTAASDEVVGMGEGVAVPVDVSVPFVFQRLLALNLIMRTSSFESDTREMVQKQLGITPTAPTNARSSRRGADELFSSDITFDPSEETSGAPSIDPTEPYSLNIRGGLWAMRVDIMHRTAIDCYNPEAGEIVRYLLECPNRAATSAEIAESIYGEPYSVLEAERAAARGVAACRLATLDRYLSFLAGPAVRMVTPGSNKTHEVNSDDLWEMAKTRCLDVFIREGYGRNAGRAWKLLEQTPNLEARQVQERCLMPLAQARSTLHILAGDGLLHVQAIPRTADHAPSRALYLYEVDPSRAKELLIERTAEATTRILGRIEAETGRKRELLNAGSAKLDACRRGLELLHHSFVRLAEALLVHDICGEM